MMGYGRMGFPNQTAGPYPTNMNQLQTSYLGQTANMGMTGFNAGGMMGA